jgi:hypothetical protein
MLLAHELFGNPGPSIARRQLTGNIPSGGPMRFIHCSDLHIDSPLLGLERYPGAPTETMRASTRAAFDNVVSAAVDNKVDLLVIAGDIYDGNWPDYKPDFILPRVYRGYVTRESPLSRSRAIMTPKIRSRGHCGCRIT